MHEICSEGSEEDLEDRFKVISRMITGGRLTSEAEPGTTGPNPEAVNHLEGCPS